jgi:hypothetical protein
VSNITSGAFQQNNITINSESASCEKCNYTQMVTYPLAALKEVKKTDISKEAAELRRQRNELIRSFRQSYGIKY